MRISDWSSDVCSSDLAVSFLREADELRHSWLLLLSLLPAVLMSALAIYHALSVAYPRHARAADAAASGELFASPRIAAQSAATFSAAFLGASAQQIKRHMLASVHAKASILQRSEEHTSELQSLMSNSYAVFCLKKKKH